MYPPGDETTTINRILDFYNIFWCVVFHIIRTRVNAPRVPRSQVVVKRDEKKIRPFPRRVKIMPAAHRGVGPHSLGRLGSQCFFCVYILYICVLY